MTTLILVSSCGGSSDNESITPINLSPEANAGVDQTIDEQSEVILSGSGSDSDGNIVSYQWTQTAGADIVLTSADEAIASFSAPDVDQDEILTFSLTVTDNDGATASDDINISVARLNQFPISEAGEGATVFIADTITLNCSGSTEPDGDELSYHWQQTKGATVTLSDNSICRPKFKVPNEVDNYEFILTVTDSYEGVDTDDVSYNANLYTGEVNNWQHNHLFTYGTLPEQDSEFITVAGDFAYIGSAYDGWWIADISDPESPTLVSKVAFNETKVNEITIKDNYAFISTSQGLKIFDISTPATPIEIGDAGINQGINSVVVKDNFLYVITNNLVPKGGYNFFPDDSLPDLFSVDISTITSPQIFASLHIDKEPNAIVIEGNHAYIIVDEKGLRVIDISDVNSLQNIAKLGGLGDLFDISIKDSKVYAWSENGMKVVDVAMPSEPKLIGDLDYKSFWYRGYRSIQIMGEYLILGVGGTVNLVDISEPSSPKWNGQMFFPGDAIKVEGETIFIVGNNKNSIDRNSGLSIVDGSSIVKSTLTSSVPSKATRSIKVKDNLLYATNWTTSYEFFETIDISTPSSPSFIGDFDFKAFEVDWDQPIESWYIDENRAFLHNITTMWDEYTLGTKVRVLDITDPTSPSLLSTLDLDGDVHSINAKDNLLYTIVEDYPLAEFRIFDVTDPLYPEIMGAISTSRTSQLIPLGNEIVIQGDIAYLYGELPLQIIDVSNSHAPTLLSETEITGHIKAIENGIAYLKGEDNRLKLVDISNSSSPELIDFTDTIGSFSDITISEDIAYVSASIEGLKMYDITTPNYPLLDKTISTSGGISQVKLHNGQIYMAESSGLLTLEVEQLNTSSLIQSEQSYTLVNKSSLLNYSVSWMTNNPLNIKCLVTGGSCSSIINKQNKTAEIEWETPDIKGDYEIVILGGNTSSQHVIRDRVTIH